MAKFSREDDDEPYRPHRSGGSAGNIVLLAVGGAVLVVVGVCSAGALFLFTARSEVREAQMMRAEAEALRDEARAAEAMTRNDAAADKAVKTREEWARLLVGKTRDEVVEVAGKPDRTSDDPPWSWSYDRRSFDPASGTTDPAMTVWFRGADGTVERVSF